MLIFLNAVVFNLFLNMCCYNLTKMTRLIAICGLIFSLIMINVLATDLHKSEDMSSNMEVMLGLEWRDFLPFEDRQLPKGTFLPMAILIYSILHAGANLSLIFSTIIESGWFTIPWFLTQTGGIVCQFYSLHFHCTQLHDYQAGLIATAIVYLVFAVYFWIVVFIAQIEWRTTYKYDLTDFNKHSMKMMRVSANGLTECPIQKGCRTLEDSAV